MVSLLKTLFYQHQKLFGWFSSFCIHLVQSSSWLRPTDVSEYPTCSLGVLDTFGLLSKNSAPLPAIKKSWMLRNSSSTQKKLPRRRRRCQMVESFLTRRLSVTKRFFNRPWVDVSSCDSLIKRRRRRRRRRCCLQRHWRRCWKVKETFFQINLKVARLNDFEVKVDLTQSVKNQLKSGMESTWQVLRRSNPV